LTTDSDEWERLVAAALKVRLWVSS
jgi:hypothetical protein